MPNRVAGMTIKTPVFRTRFQLQRRISMTIPAHRFIFILLVFLSIPSISTAQTVTIPDANLRAVIEVALGKASGAAITSSDMAALPRLRATGANISDLTGLEHAINLTELYLAWNSISDISVLGGLTNLTRLALGENSISDISVLGGLTNLTWLALVGNSISDISVLGGLTNLTRLLLERNSISDISVLGDLTNLTLLFLGENSILDISVLGGLTNLTWLILEGNSISDLSALVANTGLGGGDAVNVQRNPLSSVSIDTHIPALQSRGVTVDFDDIMAGVVVEFPDSNLRAVIERELGIASGDPITTSDMAALTQLDARQANISNLTGLEHAINLTELYLSWNSLSDITSLSGLTNLTRLTLDRNSVSDISSLSGLRNLTWLHLGNNTISDITSLSGLTNLTSLSIYDNSVSDITSLSGLTNLTWLSLDRNSISDLSALVANTGLGGGDTVNVKGNPLSSVSIDTHIPALQSRGVTVDFDDIVAEVIEFPDSNLRAVIERELGKASGDTIMTSDMAALTRLDARRANINNLAGLEHAINLTSLTLRGNSVSDITSLSGLTNLTSLSLWDNSVSDITSLSGLTNLTWLNLGNNTISDITSLSGLTNLTELFIYDNMILDISSLSGLTNLTILWLGGNLVSDITSLSGNLTGLDLSNNSISDISSLAELTNLTSLSLDRNSISDLSALVANTGLGDGGTVNVKRNPLSSVSIDTHIPALQSRGVTVEFDDIVAGVVEFPDSNLRAAIEVALDIASGDPITTSDMAALTRLDARRSQHQQFDRAGSCNQPDRVVSLGQLNFGYIIVSGAN